MRQIDNIETITLFVDDLEAARLFYGSFFGGETIFKDQVSTMIRLGEVMINLLAISEAAELVEPLRPAPRNASPRALLTIRVEDVDRLCASLSAAGVELLNGPVDRPWGRRTAAFADPAGHVWELAQLLQ